MKKRNKNNTSLKTVLLQIKLKPRYNRTVPVPSPYRTFIHILQYLINQLLRCTLFYTRTPHVCVYAYMRVCTHKGVYRKYRTCVTKFCKLLYLQHLKKLRSRYALGTVVPNKEKCLKLYTIGLYITVNTGRIECRIS